MNSLVLPSQAHQKWAECEFGVIIHLDLEVFDEEYRVDDAHEIPSASLFRPDRLDTDQWIATAADAGAKYAILTAKHGTGFCLWPTRAYDYSVASSPWRGGKGDIVADFLASCRKYGLLPGLYASTSCNRKKHFDGNRFRGIEETPETWNDYIHTVTTQLAELWTNYGPLFEIWFDGGTLPPEHGGNTILELLSSLQKDAIVFQGAPDRHNCVRWIGNERATPMHPCRATVNTMTQSDGVTERSFDECYRGSANGKYWCPGEADMPNRDQNHASHCGWFWQKNEDFSLYPPEELLERYYASVGNNCNLLLGMVIDSRGLVPDADQRQFKRFGELVRQQFSCPRGATNGEGLVFDIPVTDNAPVDMVCVMEDIAQGERVLHFIVSGFDGEHFHTLLTGSCIGHKFLRKIPVSRFPSYRLEIRWHKPDAPPILRDFSLWDTLASNQESTASEPSSDGVAR